MNRRTILKAILSTPVGLQVLKVQEEPKPEPVVPELTIAVFNEVDEQVTKPEPIEFERHEQGLANCDDVIFAESTHSFIATEAKLFRDGIEVYKINLDILKKVDPGDTIRFEAGSIFISYNTCEEDAVLGILRS